MKSWIVGIAVSLAVAAACSNEDSFDFGKTASGATSSTVTSGVGGGGEGGACTADLASIQTTLFLSRCSNSGCHNATDLAGDLDLVTAGLDKRLIDVKAANCTGLRVQPGSPDASIL